MRLSLVRLLLAAATLGSCLAVPEGGFAPLGCNANIDSDDCISNAVGFSTIFSPSESSALTIPCGMCVVMDYTDGSTITIPGGLNVVGRLHFPASTNVVVRTTAVFVQGKWSMEAPDSGNTVTLSLYGSGEKTFYPHDPCCQNIDDVYGYDCSCADPEGIGRKPFVVAGGQLDIRAVDENCSSWSKLKEVIGDQSIKVDTSFAGCLRPGDDILVTTDTREWDDHSLFTVDSVDATAGIVTFQETMPRVFPAEADLEEPRLAIEVALLRRDVVFTTEEDPDEHWIGGHSIVYFTPTVVQTIQGIRFDNFGQEGVLGRYPLHFHKSGDTASLISKNVIINSNQRCVFIHDTNYVTIDDNVAFDTRGHCYATETGSEENNVFSNNLGAYSKDLRRDNGQSDFADGGHGHAGSTFWFRNMKNTFVNNVAAGAVNRGFWLELADKYQSSLNAGSFKGNVAHSTTHGLITYQRGWLSPEESIIDDFVSFGNNEGAKFHITGNITFQNSLFADNFLGVRYAAWNKGIAFEDCLFLLSEPRNHRVATEVSFNNRPDFHKNIKLKDTVFRNYAEGATIMEFRDHNLMEDDMGDPVHLEGVTLENCDAGAVPQPKECGPKWRNFFMEDADGTFAPAAGAGGFFLRDHDLTRAFLPAGVSCTPILEGDEPGCLAYCEGICVRLVHLTPAGRLDSTNTAYDSLELTDAATGISYRYPLSDGGSAIVVLPAGHYDGEFLDADGDPLVIDWVNVTVFAEPRCQTFVTPADFSFGNTLPPTPSPTSSPTVAPSPSPSSNPTKYYDRAYVSVGDDLKCPSNGRLFKLTSVQTTLDCRDLCFDLPSCNYFSYDWSRKKMCIACLLEDDSELETHNGFDAYALDPPKAPIEFGFDLWNGISGVDMKCPYGDDRILKTNASNRRECFELCRENPECVLFSFGEDWGSNEGDCILCRSDANLEGLRGMNAYEML